MFSVVHQKDTGGGQNDGLLLKVDNFATVNRRKAYMIWQKFPLKNRPVILSHPVFTLHVGTSCKLSSSFPKDDDNDDEKPDQLDTTKHGRIHLECCCCCCY